MFKVTISKLNEDKEASGQITEISPGPYQQVKDSPP